MNDMCIVDDSVFLCGQELASNGSFGCIATMNLNNFYTGSVLVSYFEPSYWMALNLKRIMSFKYSVSGNIYKRFVLVGDISYPCDGMPPFPSIMFNAGIIHEVYYTDSNSHSTCSVSTVFEVGYPFPYLPVYDNIIRFINPVVHSEVIHDVVVTDNYVAFVGVSMGATNAITLHVCNKRRYTLYTNSPSVISDFDNYYSYSLGTTSGSPFYHACALDGDMIAIATREETSPGSNKITVRTFDLSTHTMTHAQDLRCNTVPELRDMAYIPDKQRIVLLFHDYFRLTGSYSDVFCTIDPYNVSSSYTLPGMVEDVFHSKYGSLDVMKSSYLISTGGKYGFVSDVANYSPTGTCYKVEDYYIYGADCINAVPSYFDYDLYDPSPTEWQTVVTPVEYGISSQCMDY